MPQSAAPLVSVVMPVRDAGRWLAPAIRSICEQTLRDIEIIVVDDGSADGSAAIVAEAAARDARIALHRQDRLGLCAALNRGIALARAPLIARMDGDDIALPARLERQAAFLAERPDAVAVGAWAEVMDEDGRRIGRLRPPTDAVRLRAFLWRQNPFVHSSMLMRSEAVRSLGGYRAVAEGAEDYDLWLRLSERADLANLPEPLMRYRRRSRSARETVAALFAARLVREAASRRRVSKPDFLDGLQPPLHPEALAFVEGLAPVMRLYGRLLRDPDATVTAREVLDLRQPWLDHAERRAVQMWLAALLACPVAASTRRAALRCLVALHPPRGLRLALRTLPRRVQPKAR